MSQSKAISAYSNRNPVLKLFAHAIPGSRHFSGVVWRLCTLGACLAAIVGVYHLAGGDVGGLWSLKTFCSMVALTFVLSTIKIGFRHTTVGFGSFVLGAPDKADKHWSQFNEHIRAWAFQAAHIFALMNLFTQRHNIHDMGSLSGAMENAVLGYIYAVGLGLILPVRGDHEKAQFSDTMMPGVFLICGYYLMRWLMI